MTEHEHWHPIEPPMCSPVQRIRRRSCISGQGMEFRRCSLRSFVMDSSDVSERGASIHRRPHRGGHVSGRSLLPRHAQRARSTRRCWSREATRRGQIFVKQTRLVLARRRICRSSRTFCYVSFESLESGRVMRIAKANDDERFVELEGAADLTIEAVSDSSVRKDTVRLPALVLSGQCHGVLAGRRARRRVAVSDLSPRLNGL